MDTSYTDYTESIDVVIDKLAEMMGLDKQTVEAEIGDFRDEHLQKEGVFVGSVEVLEGAMGQDGRRFGAVVLSLKIAEGEVVRARATLTAEDYMRAHDAHMKPAAYIRVAGRLGPERQPKLLTRVTSFEAFTAG
ncbi:hypothetical protein [Cupriavidus plantarum]|nr:hypothetical protein [Cupriavidus plantarum]